MSQEVTVEQRVAALEFEVAGIKRQLQQPEDAGQWLDERAKAVDGRWSISRTRGGCHQGPT